MIIETGLEQYIKKRSAPHFFGTDYLLLLFGT
jgi:hypothetical protein